MTGEHVRDHEPLDGKRLGDAAFSERIDQWLGHAEIGEGLR